MPVSLLQLAEDAAGTTATLAGSAATTVTTATAPVAAPRTFLAPSTDTLTTSIYEFLDPIAGWLLDLGVGLWSTAYIMWVLTLLLWVGTCWFALKLARRFLLRMIRKLVRRTSTRWDDILLDRNVFRWLVLFAPAIVVYYGAKVAFPGVPRLIGIIEDASLLAMVLLGVLVLDSLLTSFYDIVRTMTWARDRPIRGYIQAIKLLTYMLSAIFALSILLGQPPIYFISGLGAATAVILLVFRDTILGLVASIQVTANDLVRVGDWIEMPKYGIDGDVIDININTVRVQNWDKTILTVPTYKLIEESFKNWRGMSESGGRRIKRAVYIDMGTIRFCDEEMLQRFRKFECLRDYIDRKLAEIEEWNAEHQADMSSVINGRRLTNIGTFRAYIMAYLLRHPKIHNNMTFLVRHLQPTPEGLPIEVYVFSNDQVWANYEAIQADIFDHILAAAPEFDLRVYQNPSGYDVGRLGEALGARGRN